VDELLLTAADHGGIRRALLGGETESCAVLVCSPTHRSDGRARILAREIVHPDREDYLRRGPIEAELRPAFVAKVAKWAARTKSTLVFAHSHPGSASPLFSTVDDDGEARLAAFFGHRTPGLRHLALVISDGGLACRYLGTEQYLRVIALGENRLTLSDPAAGAPVSDEHDRQVRALGTGAQNVLDGLRVAIVGLGGTGSIAAQQLVHLGVRDFILIDPDVVERTNLNRLAGAGEADLGAAKVLVAERYIRAVRPKAAVASLRENVVFLDTAKKLRDADVIFCCTDSHGSRAVVQQISYQYLIPCVDMGTVIAVADGSVSHIAGRAQMLAPGLACFTCGGLLNGNEVRRDMMSKSERRQDPYLLGAREPAPAVMSLNGTITSLAITMFLSAVAGVPSPARHVLYDALRSRLRSVKGNPQPECIVCSRSGVLAKGNNSPIYARQD
jgi:molybdopterin-synthase adenylyltransferase